MVCVCGGKGASSFRVDTGEDVSLHSIDESNDRIHLKHPIPMRTTELCSSLEWPFDEGSGSSREGEADRRSQATALLQIGKDASNGGGGYAMSALGEENGDLVLAETRMIPAELDDTQHALIKNDSSSTASGCGGDGIETFELAAGPLEC